MSKEYVLEYKCLQANIMVHNVQQSWLGSGNNVIVGLSSDESQEVKLILNKLATETREIVSITNKTPLGAKACVFDVVISKDGFDQHFLEVKKSMVTGSKLQLSLNGKVIQPVSSTVQYRPGHGVISQGIDFIPIEIDLDDLKVATTCDCGGVKCGYADEAGPGHSDWCRVNHKGLPE